MRLGVGALVSRLAGPLCDRYVGRNNGSLVGGISHFCRPPSDRSRLRISTNPVPEAFLAHSAGSPMPSSRTVKAIRDPIWRRPMSTLVAAAWFSALRRAA